MKAQLTTEKTGTNPAYRGKDARRAKQAGKPYDILPKITYPVGTVIEGKSAYILCTLAEPEAVPADEECHAAVVAFFDRPGLKDRLDKLRQMKTPAVFEQLPPAWQQYVTSVTNKWEGSTGEKIVNKEQAVPPLEPPPPVTAKQPNALGSTDESAS